MLATWLACYRMGNRPRSKNGRKMAGSHFLGRGPKMAETWQGKGPDTQKITKFCCPTICPAFFLGIWSPPKKMAAGHFAGHFLAIFASGPVSHQLCSRPAKPQCYAPNPSFSERQSKDMQIRAIMLALHQHRTGTGRIVLAGVVAYMQQGLDLHP